MRLAFCIVFFALWASAASAERIAFIVGNNLSLSSKRSDLTFADDDAMQWSLFFERELGAENTFVFTRKDKDTSKLFGSAVHDLPTWNALLEQASALGAVPKRGALRELYFTFAGHGDVRKGQGHLELEDGPLTRSRLKMLFEKTKADRVHVVLDACHSFFLLRPRGESDSIVAIEEDAFISDEVHPNMGILLSTNSEEIAYEWTPLGAGVFSHLARSGLYGAADSNLDGVLEYREVEGFIDTASKTIANPLYRPVVFARAPKDKSAFLTRERQAGILIDVSERLSVRDAQGVRLMDIHVEEDFEPILFLPNRDGLSVYFEESAKRKTLHEVNAISTSPSIAKDLEARGTFASNAMLRSLFANPFGPRAMQRREKNKAPIVAGLSYYDRQHIRRQLERAATTAKNQRQAMIIANVLYGTLAPVTVFVLSPEPFSTGSIVLASTVGLLSLTIAGISSFESAPEKTWRSVSKGNASVDSLLVARGDLERIAKVSKVVRYVGASLCGVLSIGSLSAYVTLSSTEDEESRGVATAFFASSIALVPLAAYLAGVESREENLIGNLEVE